MQFIFYSEYSESLRSSETLNVQIGKEGNTWHRELNVGWVSKILRQIQTAQSSLHLQKLSMAVVYDIDRIN